MRIPIPCNNKRFRLTIGFTVNQPCSLILIGRDAENPYSTYISREVSIGRKYFSEGLGYREINIPFPLAPNFMMLNVWDKNHIGQDTFEVSKFKISTMEPRAIWEHHDIHDFIPFANWFSQKAGVLPVGIYDSPDLKYMIDYMSVIKNEQGVPMITPARTSRINGRIEASKYHFLPLSVPIRWFIMMHERKHFQLPTREEKVADLTALRVFLDYGFPKVEAIYACTLAMKAETTVAKQAKVTRLKDIHSFIDQYISYDMVKFTSTKQAA
jgi:hypothetical protein